MARALWLAAFALIAASCFGGAGGGTSTTPPPTGGESKPATDVIVSYPVGNLVRRRAKLPVGCVPGATCSILHLPHDCPVDATCGGTSPTRAGWIKVAHRRLTCLPPGGDYAYPAEACRALNDLAELLENVPAAGGPICRCVSSWPSATATGRYRGRAVTLHLDICSLCGLGEAAVDDVAILIPK